MVAVRNLLSFHAGSGTPPVPEAERLLVEGLRAGDPAAFRRFVDQWRGFITRVAQAVLRDPIEAQDVAQEVCIKVLRSVDRFEGQASFRTWLYSITRNTALHRFRAMRGRVYGMHDPIDSYGGPSGNRWLPSKGPNPEEHLLAREERTLARRAIGQLSEAERQLIEMSYLEGRSAPEIGRALQISAGAVRVRLCRLRQTLAGLVGGEICLGSAGVAVLAVLILPSLLEGVSAYLKRS